MIEYTLYTYYQFLFLIKLIILLHKIPFLFFRTLDIAFYSEKKFESIVFFQCIIIVLSFGFKFKISNEAYIRSDNGVRINCSIFDYIVSTVLILEYSLDYELEGNGLFTVL